MKAVSTRNGAYQYALFTKSLKDRTANFFQTNGWVTGTSSPWIDSYKVKTEKKVNSTTYAYTVDFSLRTSTGHYGNESATVTVKKVNQNWFVDKVEMKKNAKTGTLTPYVEQQTFTYRAAEYAFNIPVSWDTKYHGVEKNGNLVFYYKPKNRALSEKPLFAIDKIKEETWNKGGYDESLYVKVGLKGGYVYGLLPTSENQYAKYPNSIEYKEFEEMSALSKMIQNSFQLIN